MTETIISQNDIDLLENNLKILSSKREKLVQTKSKIEAHIEVKKTELASYLKEIRSLGSDPETVDQDILKLKSVVEKKLIVLNEDFTNSEKLFENALKHIG